MIPWIRLGLAILGVAVTTIVLLPVQLLALRFNWKLRRRLPRLWHRVACRMIGIRITVHGTIESNRPLLLASNHVSWKDILVLGAIADVVYIAKTEVRDWPICGLLARLQASIAYTGVHGMAMGRFHRPLAAWPGDIELAPHLLAVMREGAVDVDVDFGERIDYGPDSNRKAVSRAVEARIRSMLASRLRGR